MYNTFLILHNLLRWVVLISGILTIYGAYMGWKKNQVFSSSLATTTKVWIYSISLQFVVGLVLYVFLSPVVAAAMADMKAAMHDRSLRFWSVEHTTMMIAGIAIAHIGYAKSRRASSNSKRHRILFMYTLVALLIILIAIPFGIINEGRPLFRF